MNTISGTNKTNVSLKERLRSKGFYYPLFWFFRSSLDFDYERRLFLRRFGPKARILNIGSGNRRLGDNVVNLDLFEGQFIDVVGSALKLPFKDEVFDGVLMENVLEHLHDYQRAIKEAFRVLKKGGRLYSFTPFMYPLHSAPEDYYRFTPSGLRHIYASFTVEKIVCAGPGASLINALREYLAILLSGGSRLFYRFWSIILLGILVWLLLPLRLLDLWLRRLPTAEFLASGYSLIAKK